MLKLHYEHLWASRASYLISKGIMVNTGTSTVCLIKNNVYWNDVFEHLKIIKFPAHHKQKYLYLGSENVVHYVLYVFRHREIIKFTATY